ncbi:hypothetical protein [Laceyella putida]|uniref:Uncharacterized protein n=1 Tax=Laceyella putida TaxID=110101 RepID=A0ABW2RPT0_9BACL
MGTLASLDNVFYPPGGIGYIMSDLADLVSNKIQGKKEIIINCSAQPNSHPHLGTVTTMMTAFAVGKYLGDYYSLPVKVIFDQLENSPAQKLEVDGVVYQKSLSDIIHDGRSLADTNMEFFRYIFAELSKKTGVPHVIRSYEEYQNLPTVRRILLGILQSHDEFARIVSPSDQKLHVRFPCPVCKFADKHAKTSKIKDITEDSVTMVSRCFEHGEHQVTIREDNQDFVDFNAALRDLIKGAFIIEEDQENETLSIMVDGGDWSGVWALRVHCEGLLELGYWKIATRIFAPVIVDWSGAKFSKSLYVRKGAYNYLPKGLIDFSAFLSTYGTEGFDKLWGEVQEWVKNPSKLFRNYSVDYFQLILEK